MAYDVVLEGVLPDISPDVGGLVMEMYGQGMDTGTPWTLKTCRFGPIYPGGPNKTVPTARRAS